MPSLPALDINTNINHSPHVVILGSGATVAAFPKGDKFGRQLPLMYNLVQVLKLEELLKEYGFNEVVEGFEKFFSDISELAEYQELTKVIEKIVYDYFSNLELPDEPTLYDYLILSLRENDLIATFNWDPFLAQAYERNLSVGNLPRIAFLHGNVDIGACHDCHGVGFKKQFCQKCRKPLTPSTLLFPVGNKNYQSNAHITAEWEGLKGHLKHAYLVTIFGYSAPITDVEARKMLLDAWMSNNTRELAEISVIDIKPREEVVANWQDFIVRQHFSVSDSFKSSLLHNYPRRSCEAFAMATLQQEPWVDNPWPEFSNMREMHEWISPLLNEEENKKFTGNQCPSVP